MRHHLQKILITEKQIEEKVKELGALISRDYEQKDLVIIGVLKGAVVFLADLIREIKIPLALDFISTSSYGASTRTSGVVRILKDLDKDITAKDVLLVEDIIDTGLTLSYLTDNLRARQPASLKICTFLDKPERRQLILKPDYKGYDIPNDFVVGYGLDYNEKYRNLPYVGVLKPKYYQV
ncbi:MAG TPA: hypoxanthine phosphoribosyltransferase [Clostridia bacterium]|jgi:hypoxanthine phosphoribosyltransferase|nr:hypoxanthine phosphoribosyltransferase [Clostridia bacterium]